ncbi:restriction endonuclease subunit S [Tepidicella xavieri]|uniref:Type I restriction enzyme S subunit n=1 Tax=Tepidicella xavieri TaxID=360241 RepID=A0A4R6ULI6_9BURK|nr:restriction endonuclease subunit S [Tepidicella xavieri]TDQ44104.1 type I restriction enzyme S subunit [Tepidicella xavieri]
MAGEELLGPAPYGWKYTTLGTACQLGGGDIQTGPFGSQLHAADYVPVGIPSIMPQNIGDNRIVEDGIARITPEDAKRLSRYLVRAGDIVYSRRGDVERRALVRDHEDGWLCGTGCLRVRLGPCGPDPRFTSYYLGHPTVREWIVRHAHGATMPNLNTSILSACPLLVPPPNEQLAIAHILGTLDDKIELLRRQNETLEAMARALFRAWFVDFEPVRAKKEGRWWRGESLPGLPAHLYDLFPERLVESEWGEIPEGWEVMSLTEFSSLNPEAWTKRTRPEQIQYVDLSNTKWGRIESVTNYDADDAPSRAQRVLRPLDTIVGTVRPGNGSYALISDDGLTASTGFAVLRPLRREYAEFVYLAATARENIERLSNLADGGAYPAVRPEIVSATQVPRAGENLINEFSHQVSSMLAGIAANERESRTLATLRDTLLPRLISGELRIPDVEAFFRERKP